jgi:hypothetical protein
MNEICIAVAKNILVSSRRKKKSNGPAAWGGVCD